MENVLKLIQKFNNDYSKDSKKFTKSIILLVSKGNSIKNAIKITLKYYNFSGIITDDLVDSILSAIKKIRNKIPDTIKNDILNKSWVKGSSSLQKRINILDSNLSSTIEDVVLAGKLLVSNIITTANKNVDSLSSVNNISSKMKLLYQDMDTTNDKTYNDIIDQLQDMQIKIRQNRITDDDNSKLKDLLAILLVSITPYLINKAVDINIRSQYRALNNTEVARAVYESMLYNDKDDDSIFGYQWKLSSIHNRFPFDICDVNAGADVGYGKGVYPKDKIPRYPAHPHCMCNLVRVLKKDVNENKKFNTKGVNNYINKLSDVDISKIFTVDNLSKYLKTGDWEKTLSNWNYYENPTVR